MKPIELIKISICLLCVCCALFSCVTKHEKPKAETTTSATDETSETIEFEKKLRNDTVTFPKVAYDKVVAYSMKKYYIPLSDEKNFPPSLNGFGFISSDFRIVGSQVTSKVLDSTQINRLFKTLRTSAVGSSITTACVPANRDAVIFYKKGKPVGVMAICFECGKTYFHPDAGFAVGDSGWAQLKSFFASLNIQEYEKEASNRDMTK